ncbi:MAG TPA: hypothetical protein VJH97_07230 [Candidatus Nanoarchaeia archaeon]|nr:hypothetical protein [Candidatus Nanoarchaeia archaeon]
MPEAIGPLTELVQRAILANDLTHSFIWDFMTAPSDRLRENLVHLDGNYLVAGGSGKMGPELGAMIARADSEQDVVVSARFSKGRPSQLNQYGNVVLSQADFLRPEELAAMPTAPHIVYMVGRKFDITKRDDLLTAHQLNVILPERFARRHSKSDRIVVFSSGNPYEKTYFDAGGSRENDPLGPTFPYGFGVLGREMSFESVARETGTRLSFNRLMYSQHFCYGVIVDLARKVQKNEEIYLAKAPFINLIWQNDANESAIDQLLTASSSSSGKGTAPGIQLHPENEKYATIMNVAGPCVEVRYIVEKLGEVIGLTFRIVDTDNQHSLLANDSRYRDHFLPDKKYRFAVDDMITAVGLWVKNHGENWNIPTHFGEKM